MWRFWLITSMEWSLEKGKHETMERFVVLKLN